MYLDAGRLGQLDRRGADAARRRVDEHALTGAQRSVSVQCVLFEKSKRHFGVPRIAAMHHLIVRHRDDHRQRLAFGDEVVGDEAGTAVDVPRRCQFAAPAQQI